MASCACARFTLLAAIAALLPAGAMRDTFDANSALDVSHDEAHATMLNEKCCCANHAFGSTFDPPLEGCVVVSIEDLEYIVAKGSGGEGKWACPKGFQEEVKRSPPNCGQEHRKTWTRPEDYEHVEEALKIGDDVLVDMQFDGTNTQSVPFLVEQGVAGKVVKGNEKGKFTIDFGGDAGWVVCDEDKLSNLCRNLPAHVEPKVSGGSATSRALGRGASLSDTREMHEAVDLGDSLETLQDRLANALKLEATPGDLGGLQKKQQALEFAIFSVEKFSIGGVSTDDLFVQQQVKEAKEQLPVVQQLVQEAQLQGGATSKARAAKPGTTETDGVVATEIRVVSIAEARRSLENAMTLTNDEVRKQQLGAAILTAKASMGESFSSDPVVKRANSLYKTLAGGVPALIRLLQKGSK